MILVPFPAEPLVEPFLLVLYPELSSCEVLLDGCFCVSLTARGLLCDCRNIVILLFLPVFGYHIFTCTVV